MGSLDNTASNVELLEKEWYIEAPWGRICVIAWGDCYNPPVLLCHGENDSVASFRPLLKLLPRNFYYIGMELPGNGRSDPFPQGLMISLFDLVYPLEVVRKHFRWKNFIYLAHSIATIIGRLYNISYPGKMSKVIELDQVTPFLGIPPERFADWYEMYFTKYFEKYYKYNSPKETAPRYTWDQAISKICQRRGLSPEAALATLQRWSEPTGDGRIRLTTDQRIKHITPPPFSLSQLEVIYTFCGTPTLGVVATNSISKRLFINTPYLLNEKAFPSHMYRVRIVEGNHDVHVISPDKVAPYVTKFLLYGVDGLDEMTKAKL